MATAAHVCSNAKFALCSFSYDGAFYAKINVALRTAQKNLAAEILQKVVQG